MFDAFKNRRPWAAALITFFLGPFIGMLYLNRGRLALLYLLAEGAIAAVSLYFLPTLIASSDRSIVGWVIGLPLTIFGTIQAILIARRWDATQRIRRFARWYTIGFFVVMPFGVALAIRTFLYQPFNAVSVSMSPTLDVGDCFFASKFAYRASTPQRGDLIVFRVPSLGVDYIKRVIGVPGDKVEMRNDRLFIDGMVVPQRRIADILEPCGQSRKCHVMQYEETLPGGRTDHILDRVTNGPFDNTPVFVVPPNSYFVLGDNRDNSDDSRADVGFVSRGDIIGRVAFKYIENGHWVWKPVN